MRSLLVLLAAVSVSACATHGYVSREVGEVNKKVDAVSAEVEKTQQRVQQNEAQIDSVDKSAQAGIGEAKGSATAAMSKAQDAERAAKGKLIYTVTLSNDKVRFPVNKGVVLLKGKAPDLNVKLRAIELTLATPGVRRVASEIEVAPEK